MDSLKEDKREFDQINWETGIVSERIKDSIKE
jgi:hypothetical protein